MAEIMKPENVRYRGQTGVSREEQPEGDSQAYDSHAFVYIDANGELSEISTTAEEVTAIYAIDTHAASGVQTTPRNVEPVVNDAEIRISLSHSQDENLAVTAQTLVGQFHELRRVTIGGEDFWTVDVNGTANPHVQIQKISPEFPMGELHGLVYAKVIKTLDQYQP